MTNNERFNRALNACGDPRRVYMALWALAASPSCLSQLAAHLDPQKAPESRDKLIEYLRGILDSSCDGEPVATCPQAR